MFNSEDWNKWMWDEDLYNQPPFYADPQQEQYQQLQPPPEQHPQYSPQHQPQQHSPLQHSWQLSQQSEQQQPQHSQNQQPQHSPQLQQVNPQQSTCYSPGNDPLSVTVASNSQSDPDLEATMRALDKLLSCSLPDPEHGGYTERPLTTQVPVPVLDFAYTSSSSSVDILDMDHVSSSLGSSAGSPRDTFRPLQPPMMQSEAEELVGALGTRGTNTKHFSLNLGVLKEKTPVPSCTSQDIPLGCSNLPLPEWKADDVMNWVYAVASKYNIDHLISGEKFQNIDGHQLCQMMARDFNKLGEGYAELFFRELEEIRRRGTMRSHTSLSPVLGACRISGDAPASTSHLPSSSETRNLSPTQPPSMIRKRGRPRKEIPLASFMTTPKKQRGRKPGQRSKGHHLWEFIRDLLLNRTYCPSVIRWEERANGVFRIVDSKVVANLWGIQKKNRNMTYEKLSRAIRFCQKESVGYFSKLPGSTSHPKKLCFKFGPRTSGWQTYSSTSQKTIGENILDKA